ncbi:MAG: Co2+/Mg2+ efflux protein ApaG [Gammaproteobacteria bacterium]|nr:Co2+/Mg2+ efflux protein ApaG [Gammaproteobacteria bacterium]
MKNNIKIKVKADYIEDQSAPSIDRYVFAYTISITNNGQIPVKLISRHWIITDGHGSTQEVRGAGVVGEQPYLAPGESFKYTSGTVMESPVGSMHGTYRMINDDQEEFDATIPSFTLSIPYALH